MLPPQDEYTESRVLTASPHQLHLLVVDAAIRHATNAVEALSENNFELQHDELSHARDHVSELMGGLQESQAPELVEQLKMLFAFCYRRLAEADIHHKPKLIEDAIFVLSQHRETWVELIDVLANDAPPIPAPHFNQQPERVDSTYETGTHEWTL